MTKCATLHKSHLSLCTSTKTELHLVLITVHLHLGAGWKMQSRHRTLNSVLATAAAQLGAQAHPFKSQLSLVENTQWSQNLS